MNGFGISYDIIFATVAIVFCFIAFGFWMQSIFKTHLNKKLDIVEKELEEKKELVAQIPFLKTNIEKLEDEKISLNATIDFLKEKTSQKNVIIAENEKDKQNYLLNISEKEKSLQKLKNQNSEYKDEIEILKDKIFDFKITTEKTNNKNRQLQEQIDYLNKEINKIKANNEELIQDKNILIQEKSKFETNLFSLRENNKKLQDDFNNQSKKLELKLNEIMQQTIDNKIKKFDEASLKSLDNILKPFKNNIDIFQKQIRDSKDYSTKKFAELSKEIEMVVKAGMNISKEAENLTKALKGKKQAQGSWGEMILDSVLEYSGLLKGVHYDKQESYRDEKKELKRPDVVVKLPQNRTIIIDSKVSLNDYDNYIKADNEKEKILYAKNISAAFKNHIDTLNSKDYAHYKSGTLQYIFMFVPIEGAFATAVQNDPSLYEYALRKHIAIVTPSTLTISLRTIYLYWQSEQSTTLATKLFDEAGRLYDKMVGFSDSFRKIGNQIQTLQNSFETAHTQLAKGGGNVLKRVENLKKLGAKTTKSLKDSKIEYEDFDEENVEVKMLK